MTLKLDHFLNKSELPTPFLVLDVGRVEENYTRLKQAIDGCQIYYAVKANPSKAILERLVGLGSCFDAASLSEIKACLNAGAQPEHISFGNTIKKERDIAEAYFLGVRLFAFDSEKELAKIARSAPQSNVYCRILVQNIGAEWPLSAKFGCDEQMAYQLMKTVPNLNLKPYGISFHVGSQQLDANAWVRAIQASARIARELSVQDNIEITAVNLGGGYPVRYHTDVSDIQTIGEKITVAINESFGNHKPTIMIEPGRFLVADAGAIQTEVVLVSKKSAQDKVRWVYLDIGRFGGMAETEGEAIKYAIDIRENYANQPFVFNKNYANNNQAIHQSTNQTVIQGSNDNVADFNMVEDQGPVILAGPTCDSTDTMYEKYKYIMSESLDCGHRLNIRATGAYTTSYASQNFNGFKPMDEYYI